MFKLISSALFCLLFISCTIKKPSLTGSAEIVNQLNSPVNKQHHIGFVLKDLSSGKVVESYQADKNFTAASNIKLFTFWAGLNMLGDSIPSLQYVISKDSLIIWPMADPTFLHPDFKNQPSFDFLKNSGK